MATAKDIVIKQIDSKSAREFVRRVHYSGKVDTRSQLHFGVFLNGRLEGAMQFGPSMAKWQTKNLFTEIGWNEWIELHRLAFTDNLPRNSESRAIGIAIRLLKSLAPHVKVLISYADGTQCGDGTIYRASGFILTGINKNSSMWMLPGGEVCCNILFDPGFQPNSKENSIKAKYGKTGSEASVSFLRRIGAEQLHGFQMRYMYFLDPSYRTRLTVSELPFSEIERRGAKMYKGIPGGTGEIDNAGQSNASTGGASPTVPLLIQNENSTP
jgi:hypothetical protein